MSSSLSIEVFDLANKLLTTLYCHFKIDHPPYSNLVPDWFDTVCKSFIDIRNPLVKYHGIKTFITLLTLPPNYELKKESVDHILKETPNCATAARIVYFVFLSYVLVMGSF